MFGAPLVHPDEGPARRAGAISTYEALLKISLEPAAIKALDAIYRETERYEDLLRLSERQLDQKVGNLAELYVNIALVARQHTGTSSGPSMNSPRHCSSLRGTRARSPSSRASSRADEMPTPAVRQAYSEAIARMTKRSFRWL